VDKRAEEKVARRDVLVVEEDKVICGRCLSPFYKTGRERLCSSCRIEALKRFDYSAERMALEKEKILRRSYVNS